MASKESILRTTFYIDKDLKELAKVMAKEEDRTLSSFVSWLIRSYAKENGFLKKGGR